mmetsp:Transcript_29757/g.85295  ORF Transcript_29757/g.85295 Transcript_29757/m.85295 type:complete len:301 (-) Transcript_29757:1571-2473(-)
MRWQREHRVGAALWRRLPLVPDWGNRHGDKLVVVVVAALKLLIGGRTGHFGDALDPVLVELAEGAADDGDRHRQEHDADCKHAHRDQPSSRCRGHIVPIPHGGRSGEEPPKRVRDRPERRLLDAVTIDGRSDVQALNVSLLEPLLGDRVAAALCKIDARGEEHTRQHRHAEHYDERRESIEAYVQEHFCTAPKTRDLQHPEDPHETQHSEHGGAPASPASRLNIEGDDGKQINQIQDLPGICKGLAHARVAPGRVQSAVHGIRRVNGTDPQDVVQGEDYNADDLQDVEHTMGNRLACLHG